MAQYAYERLKPEYARLWKQMRVTKGIAAARDARQIVAGKERYKAVEARTTVPWFVVGCLHMRESGGSFTTWLHNGDPMRNRAGQPVRTVQVPHGRPPNPNCTWEDGAVDALKLEHLEEVTDWGPEWVAYAAEKFNGWGYRNPSIDIPSPYLWGGTSVQKPGKFVRDHVFSHEQTDPQLGVMAVLSILMQLDPDAAFAPVQIAPVALTSEVDEPTPEPMSPKAIDTETQATPSLMSLVRKSTTMRGTFLAYFASMSGWFTSLMDKLHDPVFLTLFVVGVAVACYAVWLAVTGRINAQKIIAHLAEDDTQ